MPEKKNLLSWISVSISCLALVATAIMVYISFLTPVRITLQTSPYLYLSNSIGGLPRMRLSIGVIGSGSMNKFECISDITATIARKKASPTRSDMVKTETLIPSSTDLLPIYIRGGQERVDNIEFEYENTVDRIVKIKEWAASLKNVVSSDEVRKQIDQIVTPIVNNYYQKKKSRIVITEDLLKLEFPWPQVFQVPPVAPEIESILKKLSPDDYSKHVFFTAGNYQLTVKFYSPKGMLLEEKVVDFTIENTESARLTAMFDQWTVKRIISFSPTK